MELRRAIPDDSEAVTALYNRGVAERTATFQPEPVDPRSFRDRIAAGELFLVALDESGAHLGAAWISPYDPLHDYYAGVGEASVFVAPSARRRGVGRSLLAALGHEAASAGRHKLVAKIISTNRTSLALFAACGYREVGTHHRHGAVDDEWKDVVLVERILPSPV